MFYSIMIKKKIFIIPGNVAQSHRFLPFLVIFLDITELDGGVWQWRGTERLRPAHQPGVVRVRVVKVSNLGPVTDVGRGHQQGGQALVGIIIFLAFLYL